MVQLTGGEFYWVSALDGGQVKYYTVSQAGSGLMEVIGSSSIQITVTFKWYLANDLGTAYSTRTMTKNVGVGIISTPMASFAPTVGSTGSIRIPLAFYQSNAVYVTTPSNWVLYYEEKDTTNNIVLSSGYVYNYFNFNQQLLPTSPPTTPTITNFNGSNICGGTIKINWTNSTGESNYYVYRSTDNINFTLIVTLASNVVTYTDTGRSVNTTYYYKVAAGNGIWIINSTVVSTSLLFNAPTIYSTSSFLGVNLNWTDNNSCSTGFRIERKLTTGSTWSVIAGSPSLLSSGTTSFLDTTASRNISYDYRMQSFSVHGDSPYSNTTTDIIIVLAPTLSVDAIAISGITLSWVDNNYYSSSFQLERKLDSGVTWSTIYSPLSGITSYVDTGATVNIPYNYRVLSYYPPTGATPYSNIVIATIATIPLAPTLDSLSGTSANQVLLTWTNNQPPTGLTAVQSFNIFRKKLNGIGGFILMNTVGSGITSLTITETVDDDFQYYVSADNVYNTTDSNSLTLPFIAYNVSTNKSVANQLDTIWLNPSVNITDIKLYTSTDSGSTYSLTTTLASGVTTYYASGLTEDTRRDYKLKYKNGSNITTYFSNNSSGVTYLNTPVITSVQQSGISQLTITWTDNSTKESAYELYRSVDSGLFSLLTTTAPNVLTYNDSGLNVGSIYTYFVRAIKEN